MLNFQIRLSVEPDAMLSSLCLLQRKYGHRMNAYIRVWTINKSGLFMHRQGSSIHHLHHVSFSWSLWKLKPIPADTG